MKNQQYLIDYYRESITRLALVLNGALSAWIYTSSGYGVDPSDKNNDRSDNNKAIKYKT